jgi:hypothetical protein
MSGEYSPLFDRTEKPSSSDKQPKKPQRRMHYYPSNTGNYTPDPAASRIRTLAPHKYQQKHVLISSPHGYNQATATSSSKPV